MFKNYPMPGYGNCFAFNKFDNKDDREAGYRVTSLTGPKFGLTLVLNVQPESYMTNGRTEQVTCYSSQYRSNIFAVSPLKIKY